VACMIVWRCYDQLLRFDLMRNLIALTFILVLTASAQASHESRRGPDLAYSCDTVRSASTQYSRERLLIMAQGVWPHTQATPAGDRLHGYGPVKRIDLGL
jgi:hypothetical protein